MKASVLIHHKMPQERDWQLKAQAEFDWPIEAIRDYQTPLIYPCKLGIPFPRAIPVESGDQITVYVREAGIRFRGLLIVDNHKMDKLTLRRGLSGIY